MLIAVADNISVYGRSNFKNSPAHNPSMGSEGYHDGKTSTYFWCLQHIMCDQILFIVYQFLEWVKDHLFTFSVKQFECTHPLGQGCLLFACKNGISDLHPYIHNTLTISKIEKLQVD